MTAGWQSLIPWLRRFGAGGPERVFAGPPALSVDDALWRIVAGSDTLGWRDITADATIPSFSWTMPGGPTAARFSVRAGSSGLTYPELDADSSVRVYYGGDLVWSGYVLPRPVTYVGGEYASGSLIEVECAGPVEILARDAEYARVFCDVDLAQWAQSEWEGLTPGIAITRLGDLVFAAASGSVFPADSYQAVWYWLHNGLVPSQHISKLLFDWTSVGAMTWEVLAAAEASVGASWASLDSGGGTTTSTPTSEAITCPAGTRALAIRVGWADGRTLTYDERVTLSRVRVLGQTEEMPVAAALAEILLVPGVTDSFVSHTLWSLESDSPPPPVPPTNSVSVRAAPYNAAGDGVTDDYASIMAACVACAGTGTAVYFPEGIYYIGDHTGDGEPWAGAITVPDDVEWVGESVGQVRIDGTVFFGSDQKFSYMRIGRAGLCAIRNVDGAADTEFDHVRFCGGGGTPESYNAPVVSLGYSAGLQRITWRYCDVERNSGTESATLSNLYNNVSIYTYDRTVSDLLWDHCNIGVNNGTGSGSPRMGFEVFVADGATYTFEDIRLTYCTVECCDSHGVNFSDAVGLEGTGVVIDHCLLKGGGLTYQTHEQWGSTLCLGLTIGAQILDNTLWDGAERVIRQYQRPGYADPVHTFKRNIIDLTQDNGVTRESYWVAVDLEGSSNVYPTSGPDANVVIGS